MLIGRKGQEVLQNASVIVFGVGGVGSACVESLARSGIGRISLVDADDVDITNLNRQLLATEDAVGKRKTAVMRERILSINPACCVEEFPIFYLPENADQLDFREFD